jgi:hypothetical protein
VAVNFIAQSVNRRNFVFQRHFPVHKIFERSCEIGLWRLTSNRISQIFGVLLTQKLRGKLATVIEPINHGYHILRVNFKNALLRQSEKFSRFLRNELLPNHLTDFGLRKRLDHLDAVPQMFPAITIKPRFSMCSVDFPFCNDSPRPYHRPVRYPGIRIEDALDIRLLEVFLHGRPTVRGRTDLQIHQAVVHGFEQLGQCLPAKPTPLRSAQAERPRTYPARGRRYAYQPTKVWPRSSTCSLTSVSSALANSCFHHQPDPSASLRANWKLRITKPTTPSSKSLTCMHRRDVTPQMLKYLCLQSSI